jgi:hypothetical protein
MVRRQKAHDPTKATRRKPEPVTVRNIAHPRIWTTALKLAGGDKDLVTVEGFNRLSVIVREGSPPSA